ncbi:MAG: hypothetical protein FWE19_03985 [Oscillospiraceae bacterium]|nr:hypothetical protein [Oscillospiraceae bacterium]
MKALIKKAESGDLQSEFTLGRVYAFGLDGFARNIPEEIKCLNKAGERHVAPLRNLIGLYTQIRDTKSFIQTFETIIDKHAPAPVTMVTFGAMLCGDSENRHIKALDEDGNMILPGEL